METARSAWASEVVGVQCLQGRGAPNPWESASPPLPTPMSLERGVPAVQLFSGAPEIHTHKPTNTHAYLHVVAPGRHS